MNVPNVGNNAIAVVILMIAAIIMTPMLRNAHIVME